MTDSDPRGPLRRSEAAFQSLSPAVWRASTVLFGSVDEFTARKSRLFDGYTYGVTGTPTTSLLEERIARLEGCDFCVAAPSGQAALCMVALSLLRGGDHVLISESAYGPLRAFARDWLRPFGVEVDFFPPTSGAELQAALRPGTKAIFLESPGSVTMEMQDLPAIVGMAQARGITTVLDNTWATPLGLQAARLGVDVVVQAASKFFGGHSDVLLGAISTPHRSLYEQFRTTQSVLGQAVSADDCSLVLRGLETLEMRYAHQCRSALQIAQWLAAHDGVEAVLFPPLESDAGHARWARSFQGGGCVLSFVPAVESHDGVRRFFQSLRAFAIGASWGGVHSLAAYYPAAEQLQRRHCQQRKGIVRLSVGLEATSTLLADLADALSAARPSSLSNP